SANFTVSMSNASMAAVTVAYTVTGAVADSGSVAIPAGQTSGSIAITIPATAVAEGEEGMLTVTLTGVTVASGGGTAMLGAATSATVTVTSDDADERAARLEAPLAAAARGIGQLAANAVARRANFAGQNFNAETLAAAYLAGGHKAPAELLRQSGFSLAHGDSGLNIWGGGDYIAAEGDHNGITYDGDTTAFHLGMDTTWRDGLIGIAAANSAGDLDFTANGVTSTLETNVTSIHPYLARRLNNAQLWTTIGYGSGEAELKEPGANITTDLTVLTAAFNIAHAPGDMLRAQVGALYSRAALDEVAGPPGLSKVTVHTLRINAAGEVGWSHDNWRPFVTVSLRHDAGDGDVGSAGDLGGGVEWQTPTAILRLSGATHFAGDGAEEDRLTFTARQNAGRLNLGLNLTADNGLNTANLLSGEWRF
ncbi:MAG: autotransporter outer membrane beta-barrel domain-containing protein, partial [Gammaproteobacteria bacterium]|nr:autotransporter outer membrane beta-barrel domain-containing protein [Gammaproteobacteria bacterium]